MIERYSFTDFVNYCSERNPSFRPDGEIYWLQTKPIPSILVKRLFFSADLFLVEYVHHLLSATVLALHDLTTPNDKIFDLFPNPKSRIAQQSKLEKIWRECQSLARFKEFEQAISSLSGLGAFELSLQDFLNCLDHTGKKYDRLYYPDVVKKHIDLNFPKVSELLSRSNGDMFGNIVVDKLNVYRSGFSDAFSGLFNDYLTFKFDFFPLSNPKNAAQGQTEAITIPSIGSIKRVEYSNGNFWEPTMQQGGAIGVEVAKNHPASMLDPELQFNLLLLALAKEEMKIFDPDLKLKLEQFRYRVSVALRAAANSLDSKMEAELRGQNSTEVKDITHTLNLDLPNRP
jgi:hypothetical protein